MPSSHGNAAIGMLSFRGPCAEVNGDSPVLPRAPAADHGRTRWAAHPAGDSWDLRESLMTPASPCREAWGISSDIPSLAGSGRAVKELALPFFTPIPFCPLGHESWRTRDFRCSCSPLNTIALPLLILMSPWHQDRGASMQPLPPHPLMAVTRKKDEGVWPCLGRTFQKHCSVLGWQDGRCGFLLNSCSILGSGCCCCQPAGCRCSSRG